MNRKLGRQHLTDEIRRFGEQWNLTPRERDVLELIAFGTTRIKDVAETLKLSPNTVNNHVNSIFAKTQTRSKSELLTRLLSDLTNELVRYRLHHQSPRVLICGSPETCETLVSALDARGCRAGHIGEPEQALSTLRSEPVNFLILDTDMTDLDVRGFLGRMAEPPLSWTRTLVIGSEPTQEARAALMDAGAIDLMAKPLDPDGVYSRLMSHYTESAESLAQFEADLLASAAKGRVIVELKPETSGRGGLFLPSAEISRSIFAPVGVGDRVDLEIHLKSTSDGVTIEAPGQIVWLREHGTNTLPAGAGVRFIPLRASDRERLSRFQQNHRIRPYIPLGGPSTFSI